MSVESRVTSVYQLPKFQLIAAPRHVYSSQRQMEDNCCKSSASQPLDSIEFRQKSQRQSTAKSTLHTLQTQECSRKFSSALLSSQTSLNDGDIPVPSSTAVAVTVSNGADHIRPALSHATDDRKIKSFPASASNTTYGIRFSHVNEQPTVPKMHRENARCQKSGKSLIIPCSTGTVVEKPKKDRDRSTGCSAAESSHWASLRSRSAWKSKVDDSHKNRSTCNVVSASCNDAAVKQPHYVYTSRNNVNNSNCLQRQSDFARQHLIDRASYYVSSQRKVETDSRASLPLCGDGAKRRVSVSLLMQNGRLKGSQFTVTAAERDLISSQVAAGVLTAAASDSADNAETPEQLQTGLQPNSAAVVVKQCENYAATSCAQDPVSRSCEEPVDIKIEKRLISNTPMSICTLPVPRPAFVCTPLVPEPASARPPSLNCSGCVPRSYHETTRSHRRETLPPTAESGQSGDRRRSGLEKIMIFNKKSKKSDFFI